jgi:hypothetical protein
MSSLSAFLAALNKSNARTTQVVSGKDAFEKNAG